MANDKGIQRLQIDDEKIRAGTIMSDEELILAFQESQAHGYSGAYWGWILQFKNWIEERSMKLGRPVIVRQINNGLHFIQGVAASEYLHTRAMRDLLSIQRLSEKMKRVETERMTEEEIRKHTRRDFVMDSFVESISKTSDRLGIALASQEANKQLKGNVELPEM